MTSIPKTPVKLPLEQKRQLDAISELLEVGEGQRGDPTLRKLTVKDLITLGMIQIRDGFSVRDLNRAGSRGLTPVYIDPILDMSPPPQPSGLTVNGAISNMLLSWDAPTASNHSYTEVWRHTTDNLAAAVLLGTSSWAMYADAVGPGESYYYWIRFVSAADVNGPYNDTVGTLGQTAVDVTKLIEAIQGEIDESSLTAALNTRLNLVDDPVTGLVKKTADFELLFGETGSAATSAANALASETAALDAAAAALVSKDSALAAAAAALVSEGAALGSKNAAASSATTSAAEAVIAAGGADTATTQAGIATSAQTAASGSATTASTKASEAVTSASNAAGSASTATTQAGIATAASSDASGFATNAGTSAGQAAASVVTAAGSASTATTQAGIATSASDTASGAASTASSKAAEAVTSASNAAGSASTATTQAGLATTAKNAAGVSETNASTSATGAATSASNAAGSASTAFTDAGVATSASSAASGSATTASTKAAEAATSATNASGSASTATTQAGLATAASSDASGFATDASTSATGAATSATNAAGSASTATTQAGLATSSKNAAGTSATTASTKAAEAATSATNALGSASTATTQAGIATASKDAAGASETAAGLSETAAATSASNAAGSASTATTQAGLATSSKNAAGTSATNAAASESAAATSATNASGSASTATTQAGISTAASTSASGFATTASTKATEAATSASNASGSASTATTQAGLATSSKNAAATSATNASTSAGAAATSATTAAGSASTAATQAGIATTAKDDASGFASAANVSAGAASTSAANASGSATTASTQAGISTASKNAAGTSATNAANSASAAATSASNASGSASTATTQAGLATSAKNAAESASASAGVFATNSSSSAVTAAGHATSAASSVLEIQSSAMGENLLRTSGTFESSLDKKGWSSGSVVLASSQAGVSGGRDGQDYVYKLASRDSYNPSRQIDVNTGDVIYVGGWINTTNTVYMVNIGFRGYLAGAPLSSWPSVASRAAGLDWAWVEGYYTVPSGVDQLQPFWQINGSSGFGSPLVTGVVYSRKAAAIVQTQATSINGLEAKYTVKIDVNGHVAGYGLAVDANNSTPVSTMQFAVDKFFIVSPGSADLQFAVSGGKVVMDAAFIKDATITSAKIASLNADKINAGTINANISMNALTFNGGSMNIGSGKFTVDSSGNAIAKSITIQDAIGNTLLSSGAGMPYSVVTGDNRPADYANLAPVGSLIDGRFDKTAADGWNIYWTRTSATYVNVVNEGEDGSSCLRINCVGAAHAAYDGSLISVRPGERYILRGKIKLSSDYAASSGNEFRIEAHISNSAGSNFSWPDWIHADGIIAAGGLNTWVEFEGYVDIPANARHMKLACYKGAAATAGHILIDGLEMAMTHRISPDNISTYIANASIDTLHIGANKVVLPVSSYTNGAWVDTYTPANTDTFVEGLTASTENYPATFTISCVISVGGGPGASITGGTVQVLLKNAGGFLQWQSGDIEVEQDTPFVVTIMRALTTTGATETMNLWVRTSDEREFRVRSRSMQWLVTKR